MKRRAPILLALLAAVAALALDWREVAGVRVPEGVVSAVAVDGETVWSRVPYDAEVDYIEATGSQYVDTLVGISSAYRIEADFEFTQVTPRQQRVFEQYDRTGHLFAALYINGSGNVGYAWSQTVADWKGVNRSISAARRTYIMDGPARLLQVGATQVTLPPVENTGTPDTATLTLGSSGTEVKPTYGKWYGAKILLGSTLVRDFVPVRVGLTGYLYDRVSGQLFGNMGTGAFVLGPDK